MAASTITNFANLKIPLEDVLKATNNFADANIIGHGGFGPAYKGRLLLSSGDLSKIAALRLDRKYGLGDVEFWTEISMLSDLKHANLVSLVGFCDEKHEKIIVIKHEANGSLKEHLNSPNLTLAQRSRISLGVARALAYLHHDEGRDYAVIHRNINSSTILLDENWEAKLSGFLVSVKQSFNRMEHVVLCEPVGTIGYMDPAIEKSKGVTHKSDIYSLGVVLLEIMCGRTAFDGNTLLAPLAIHHFEKGTLKDLIHPDLRDDQMSSQNYLQIAYYCLLEDQRRRPDANLIVTMLEENIDLQQELEKHGNNLENLKIPFDNITLATDKFSKAPIQISSRQMSIIYRAELDHLDTENPSFVEGMNRGQHPKRYNTVTVQWFMPTYSMRVEERFYRNIRMITSVKHQNIVTLLGFCDEGASKYLVTENHCNGYLIDYLGNANGLRILTWEKRLKICIDVAYALSYLHYGMEDQNMIIHCNINCYNIVVDENWRAKITGFEKAVSLPQNQEVALKLYRIMYQERYDMFYIAPEFEKTRKLNRDFDVYSFGIVMFELLCGRKANDPIYLNESLNGLAHVVRQRFRMGTLNDMVDPLLYDEIGENTLCLNRGASKDSLDTFIKIAFGCIAETQDQRPTMKVVIKELENALSLQDCLKKDRVHQLYIDQVANELEKTLELELIHKYIHEDRVEVELRHKNIHEQVQHQNVGQKMDQVVDMFQKMVEYHGNLKIRLADIKLATENFLQKYKIQSHEDYLYRGALYPFNEQNPSSVEGKAKGGRHINAVIKRYPSGHVLYRKEEFLNEIEMLTRVKHHNIVTLLGFCVEDSELILVIEKLSNGHLGYHLGDAYYERRRVLTWEKRLKICIDVAYALNYLHSETEDKKIIINRDICCFNIGLDENWGAKIVDFWWSLILPSNQEDQALCPNRVIGRPPYQDPDYLKTGKLKTESDVYGFGVVLFEILSGRNAYDPLYTMGSDKGLASVARRRFLMGTLEEMIDPIIKEEASENKFILKRGPNKDSLQTFIEIAHACVAETQDQRPTMKVVVEELEKALFLQKNKDNPRISLDDIKVATQNFHNDNYVGGGGFGKVFKGNLQDGNRFKTIVAKRLNTSLGQGERQFLTELQILLEYKHENVIGLVGYCDEEDEKIIVYEYASRGSLDRHLNNVSLTWVERLNICIDVACALHFLHEGDGKQAKVIHRDIKTANILLNHDWKAKLADFGLSLLSPITLETDYVIDYTCGTPGYLDPLYKKTGFLTIESDIYSFGVVLFEILYGRSTYSIHKRGGEFLPSFIKNKYEEGKYDEVVFEQIKESIKPKSLVTFQKIAYQCLHYEREKRPTAKKILMELKMALEFQM